MSFTNDVLADVADVLEVQPFACPSCQKDIERKVMQVHGIQGIEEGSVLAQLQCDDCEHNSLERMAVSDVLPHAAQRFVLQLTKDSDWQSRRVFKSRTTMLCIPEIGLDSASTSVAGGTILDLLEAVRDEMTNVPAFQGLAHADGMLQMMGFMEKFNDVLDGTCEATLEMEDAASRLCFIEARGEADAHLFVKR
eukprot:m.96233 g.96233  ORF g.96233 m.96233 type:complete len:194 (-) comp15044_c0_seq12:131-712(-)